MISAATLALIAPAIPATKLKSTLEVTSSTEAIELSDQRVGIEFPPARKSVKSIRVYVRNICEYKDDPNLQIRELVGTAASIATPNALSVSLSLDNVAIRVGGEVLDTLVIRNQAGSCPFSLVLERQRLEITVGNQSKTFALKSNPFFSLLSVDEKLFRAGRFEARIETFTYATVPSNFGWLIRFASVVLSVVALISLFKKTSLQSQSVTTLGRRLCINVINLLKKESFVALPALAWAIGGPPLFDDGWYLAVFTHSFHSLNFYNVFNSFDVRYPTGFIQLLSYSLWSQVSASTAWLRVLSALLVTAGFTLLRRSFEILGKLPRSISLLWTGTYLLGALGFLVSLRPEALIVFFTSLTLFILTGISQENLYKRLFLAGLFAGLCLSIHPAGVAPLCLCGTWCTFRVSSMRRDELREKIHMLLFVSLPAVTGFLLSTFMSTDFADWFETRKQWSSYSDQLPTWRIRLFTRIVQSFSGNVEDIPIRRAFAILIIVGLLLLGCTSRLRADLRWLLAGVGLILLTFSLIPTVGYWQLGVLTPITSVAIVLLWQTQRGHSHWILVFFLIFLLVIGNVTIWKSPESIPLFRFSAPSVEIQLFESFLRSEFFWLFIAGFLLVVALSRTRQTSSSHKLKRSLSATALLLVISIFLPSILQIMEVTIDSLKAPGRSSILHTANWPPVGSDCGLGNLAVLPDISSRTSLSLSPSGATNEYSTETVRLLGKSVFLWKSGGTELSKYAITLPRSAAYLLFYARQLNAESSTFTIRSSIFTDQSITMTQDGYNYRHKNGLQPILLDLSGFSEEARDARKFSIESLNPDVLLAEPFAINGETLTDLVRRRDIHIQVSPEWSPLFPCNRQIVLERGLAVKPEVIIGSIPLHPFSPASLFSEYEDLVEFQVRMDSEAFIVGHVVLSESLLD